VNELAVGLILIFGSLDLGVELCKRSDYEHSRTILAFLPINSIPSGRRADYHYCQMLNAYELMAKKEAQLHAEELLDLWGEPVPRRYIALANLIKADLQTWSPEGKGLDAVSRKMHNVGRRLELSRGGPETQKQQKEILRRLDELIKEKENEAKQGQAQAKLPCPPGGEKGPEQAGQGTPMQDSRPAANSGKGVIDQKKLRETAANWGSLPPKERAKAMAELTRDLPPRYKTAVQDYMRRIEK
jgi:hypothetical protein